MSRHHPFKIIFRGPDASHLIMLLKGGNHYEGCTTFSGFLKKRYWCHFCDKAVSNKTTHACQGRTWCAEQPRLLSFRIPPGILSRQSNPWGLWPLFQVRCWLVRSCVIKPSPVSFSHSHLLDQTRHFNAVDRLWHPSTFLPSKPRRSKPSLTKQSSWQTCGVPSSKPVLERVQLQAEPSRHEAKTMRWDHPSVRELDFKKTYD